MNNKLSAVLTVLVLGAAASMTASAGEALERIRTSGHVRFGYLPQAKPFTSAAASPANAASCAPQVPISSGTSGRWTGYWNWCASLSRKTRPANARRSPRSRWRTTATASRMVASGMSS